MITVKFFPNQRTSSYHSRTVVILSTEVLGDITVHTTGNFAHDREQALLAVAKAIKGPHQNAKEAGNFLDNYNKSAIVVLSVSGSSYSGVLAFALSAQLRYEGKPRVLVVVPDMEALRSNIGFADGSKLLTRTEDSVHTASAQPDEQADGEEISKLHQVLLGIRQGSAPKEDHEPIIQAAEDEGLEVYFGEKLQTIEVLADNIPKKRFLGVVKRLEKVAIRNGYYLHNVAHEDGDGMISFYPEVGPEIKNIPRFLYHVTATTKVEQIRKKGLQPKTSRFAKSNERRYTTKRVYLATSELHAARMAYSIFPKGVAVSLLKVRAGDRAYYHDPDFTLTGRSIPKIWPTVFTTDLVPPKDIVSITPLTKATRKGPVGRNARAWPNEKLVNVPDQVSKTTPVICRPEKPVSLGNDDGHFGFDYHRYKEKREQGGTWESDPIWPEKPDSDGAMVPIREFYRRPVEVGVQVKVTKDKLDKLWAAEKALRELGIIFDTGASTPGSDDTDIVRDWELDWSLSGPIEVCFRRWRDAATDSGHYRDALLLLPNLAFEDIVRIAEDNTPHPHQDPEGAETGKTKQRHGDPFPHAFRKEMRKKGKNFRSPKTHNQVMFDSLPWTEQLKFYKRWKMSHKGRKFEEARKHEESTEQESGPGTAIMKRQGLLPERTPAGKPSAVPKNLGDHAKDAFKDAAHYTKMNEKTKAKIHKEVTKKDAGAVNDAAALYHHDKEKHGPLYAVFNFLRNLGLLLVEGVKGWAKKALRKLRSDAGDTDQTVATEQPSSDSKNQKVPKKSPSFDEKTLRRYRGVKKLSEEGSGGERKNAQRIQKQMETKYPGIHKHADVRFAYSMSLTEAAILTLIASINMDEALYTQLIANVAIPPLAANGAPADNRMRKTGSNSLAQSIIDNPTDEYDSEESATEAVFDAEEEIGQRVRRTKWSDDNHEQEGKGSRWKRTRNSPLVTALVSAL